MALGAALVQLVAQLLGVTAAQRKLNILETAFNIAKVVEAGRSKYRPIFSKIYLKTLKYFLINISNIFFINISNIFL